MASHPLLIVIQHLLIRPEPLLLLKLHLQELHLLLNLLMLLAVQHQQLNLLYLICYLLNVRIHLQQTLLLLLLSHPHLRKTSLPRTTIQLFLIRTPKVLQ